MTDPFCYKRIEIVFRSYFRPDPGIIAAREVCDELAVAMNISDAQRRILRPDGKGPLFDNHVQYVRWKLVKLGIIERGVQGYWGLTRPYRIGGELYGRI